MHDWPSWALDETGDVSDEARRLPFILPDFLKESKPQDESPDDPSKQTTRTDERRTAADETSASVTSDQH